MKHESIPSTRQTGKYLEKSLDTLHHLESIINRSPVIYCVWKFDEHASVEYISANIAQWGYSADDFLSGRVTWYGITLPEDVPRLKKEIEESINRKQWRFNQKYRLFDSSGRLRWVEDQAMLIFDENKTITHAQGTVIDITERQNALNALQETQNLYQTVFENTGTAMAIADKNRNILLVNEKMEQLTGFRKDEFTGEKKAWSYHIHPDDLKRIQGYHRQRLTDSQAAPDQYEFRIRTKQGDLKTVFMTSEIIPGSLKSLISMIDITEWKKTQTDLRQSEERLRELLAMSSDVIFVLDEEGTFQYISPSASKILHYAPHELIGKFYQNFIHPDDIQTAFSEFKALICRENSGIPTEVRFLDGIGGEVQMEALGANALDNPAIGGIIINARDISERKRLEAELLHAQKMEAIGKLSGGIAHDFNNILMGIQGYISLLLLKVEPDHPDFEKMINIQTLVQSGADLTGRLMGFSRGSRREHRPTDINTLLEKTINLFERTKKEITVHRQFENTPWTIDVDRGQIEHVILNLLVNAWQAMPQGGDIIIRTQNVFLNAPSPAQNLLPGRYLKISITDTGIGMDKKTQQKIFEPFFTTKEKLHGMGLGLASAFSVVRDHRGTIDVESEPSRGTTFAVYLPASEKQMPQEIRADKTIVTGCETILLVDDELAILEVCRDILMNLGYTVFTAQSGQDAVETFAINQDKIDLVILDMIMPGLNGAETFARLKDIHPPVKVILSTGYSESDQAKTILEMGCVGLLQKPFLVEDLSLKIREVMDIDGAR